MQTPPQPDISVIRALGEKCKSKGCLCLARCYRCWNKWWHLKAEVCTHPNWIGPDTEWIDNDPPLVGNNPRPQPPPPPPKTRPTIEELKLKSKQSHTQGRFL